MTNLHTEVRFSIVPEWVIDADISDRAVRVYAILARYADSETHQAFPSRETLAQRARCHWRSIDRAIAELIELGAVTKTHRKHGKEYQSNIYTLKRVLPRVSRGTASGVTGVLTGESVGTDTAGNLTRTTELEPEELEPQNYIDTKKSLNRNHRLPENWYPSERLLEMFATKWPDVDRDFEIDQFINYWHAEGKTKADWDRAFQVWMNRAEQRGKPRQQARKLTNAEQGAILTLQLRQKREQREALEAVEAKKRLELGL